MGKDEVVGGEEQTAAAVKSVSLPCLPPPIASIQRLRAIKSGGAARFCSSPPLRCFSSLIQISICVCVSPEDRRCATYQEILSRYANEHSQERRGERERARVKGRERERARVLQKE